MYPEIMVIPMREELTRLGIKEARTASEVDRAVAQPGTTMIVVNSVCGCAAGRCRMATGPPTPSRFLPVKIRKQPTAPVLSSPDIRLPLPPSPYCAMVNSST
jgi:putative YphP/YqiW family bacilliredoxin